MQHIKTYIKYIFLIIFLFFVLLLLKFFISYIFQIKNIKSFIHYKPQRITRVLDRNGYIIAEFFYEKRTVINITNTPVHLTYSFLSAEDSFFFKHHGILPFSIIKALFFEINFLIKKKKELEEVQ